MGIDRKALVDRHCPVFDRIHPLSPLGVGNGDFAFTADYTGLQSFPGEYEVPLGTQSQWGWHSSGGRRKWTLQDAPLQLQNMPEPGKGGYPLEPEDREEAYHWLRQNPHRLQLAQIGFQFAAERSVQPGTQRLDLWSGLLQSSFTVDGTVVEVCTACDPHNDQLAVTVRSTLLQASGLAIEICFPAPGMMSRSWDKATELNWGEPDSHHTTLLPRGARQAVVRRSMDEDGYSMALAWSSGILTQTDTHRLLLQCGGSGGESFELRVGFALQEAVAPQSADELFAASSAYWEQFWLQGAAVELSESSDPRAHELERRIVLSQYLTAIHSGGSVPPQETGLLYNSWFGKPHLEMHWWHAFQFPLWGRAALLRRSMDWYNDILPEAERLAASQGYRGARWPKMVDPSGAQSPSGIAPLLIWQQPHPIVLAELCYLDDPSEQTLQRYGAIVLQSAEFMASFALWDESRGSYVLGPPVIPAQENHKGPTTWNPTYELEYWRHGLDIAIQWARRLGQEAPALWSEVCERLSPLPVADGVYLAHENCPETYTAKNKDHPSMLGALGMLPGKMVDRDTMRATLHKVMACWDWPSTWGWDYPMAAMTAARLDEPHAAVDLLLMEVQKNTYLPNGHNYQRKGLTAYLPGNGGLLTAIAMMAAGWQGGPEQHAPGFPADGTWTVRWEGLRRWM